MKISRSAASKAGELARYRATAVLEIIEITNTARLRFISPIHGQDMVYREKEVQARAYLDQVDLEASGGASPVLDDYPFIKSDVVAMDITGFEAASVISFLGASWRNVVGPAMETLRMSALRAVEDAVGADEIALIVAGFSGDMALIV